MRRLSQFALAAVVAATAFLAVPAHAQEVIRFFIVTPTYVYQDAQGVGTLTVAPVAGVPTAITLTITQVQNGITYTLTGQGTLIDQTPTVSQLNADLLLSPANPLAKPVYRFTGTVFKSGTSVSGFGTYTILGFGTTSPWTFHN